MSRVTKKDVFQLFKVLINNLNKLHNDPHFGDDWNLDYAACYGGYVIEQVGEKGRISHPLGSARRDAKTMNSALTLLICALINKEVIK